MLNAFYEPAWFHAADVPSPERVREFRNAFAVTMHGIDVAFPREDDFAGRILQCVLPDAVLSSCFAVPGLFRRAAVPDRPSDDVLLLRPVGGSMTASQNGRTIMVEPGDAMLLSFSAPFEYDTRTLTRIDHLRIPAAAIAPGGMDITEALLRPASAQDNRLQLLAHYAGGVMQGMIPLATERHARLAGNHMRDLASVLFGLDDQVETTTTSPVQRLKAIKAQIDRELSRRDLSIEAVARLQGITPRYVQKLFETEGTTFTGYMLDRRLDAARALILGMDGQRRRPISAIAFEVGFGDLSYFNRTFRRRFGASPRALRQGTPDAG